MEEVSLDGLGVMQGRNGRSKINQLMQDFPALAKAGLPNIERSHCQRGKQEKSRHAIKNVGFLKHGLSQIIPSQAGVEIDKDDDMDGGVHQRIQTERTAVPEHFAPAQKRVKR